MFDPDLPPSLARPTLASEIAGQFGGFVFTEAGKRRLLLRQGEHDRLLKVPRLLRRRIIGKFRAGEPIRLEISAEVNPVTGARKEVVLRVLPELADRPAGTAPIAPAPTACAAPSVIRVCSKKNCWRNGGRELFEALYRQCAAAGHDGQIEIRQVGCLDRCKHAPNVDAGDRSYSHCSCSDAGAIIARVVDHLPLRMIKNK